MEMNNVKVNVQENVKENIEEKGIRNIMRFFLKKEKVQKQAAGLENIKNGFGLPMKFQYDVFNVLYQNCLTVIRMLLYKRKYSKCE